MYSERRRTDGVAGGRDPRIPTDFLLVNTAAAVPRKAH